MKWIFWISLAVIVYSYLGYPVWLWVRARVRRRPVRRAAFFPSCSVVMVVRNEEANLRRKLHNLLALDYPAELLEIVVVSDGSSDGTDGILNSFTHYARVRTIYSNLPRGKAACLNDGIRAAHGEIVLFTDARQQIEADALRLLAENFADPDVGCASGELMLGNPFSGEAAEGMGLYWRIEKIVRELESCSGSVVGATGALYVARRELLEPVPAGMILDDVYIPMQVVKHGARVVFDGRARAWDTPNLGARREFARKVRTLTGNYQLLQLAPWLLGPGNKIRFEFVNHKLSRLAVPFALAGLMLSSMLAAGSIYLLALWAQLAFYAAGVIATLGLQLGPFSRVAGASRTFIVLNAAAAVAFANFVTGRKAAWVPIKLPARDGSRREAQS